VLPTLEQINKAHETTRIETIAKMEINSRYCEVSTYAASSSGYNSSTASSSLNYIDEDASGENNLKIIPPSDRDFDQPATKLIITITLLKTEQVLFSTFILHAN
jgi:hypothetical protein